MLLRFVINIFLIRSASAELFWSYANDCSRNNLDLSTANELVDSYVQNICSARHRSPNHRSSSKTSYEPVSSSF